MASKKITKMCNTSRSLEPTSTSPESSPLSPQLSRPKPVPTAVANALPPCRICGGKASGFHYGTNTCEACKGFFRRSVQREKGYICKRSGKCWDTSGKRRKCAACRYNTCIKMGMSKRAIKTGRYSHMKKTINTLEVKQLERELQQLPQAAAPVYECQEGQFETDSSTADSRDETDLDSGYDTVHDIQTELNVAWGSEMTPGFDTLSKSRADIAAGLDMMITYDITSEFSMTPRSQIVPGSDMTAGLHVTTGSTSEFNKVAGSDMVTRLDIVYDSDCSSEFNVTPGSQILPGADILAGLDILAGSDVDDYIESEYQKVPLSDTVPESYSAPGFSTDACPNIVPGSDTVTCSDIVNSLDIVAPGTVTGSCKMSGCTIDVSAETMPGSATVAVSDMVPRSKTEMPTDLVPVAGFDFKAFSSMVPRVQTEVYGDIEPDSVTEQCSGYLSHMVPGSCDIPRPESNRMGSDTMTASGTESLADIHVAGPFEDIGFDIQTLTDMSENNSFTEFKATDTDNESLKVLQSDIQVLSNLVPENNIETLSDTVPRSHTITDPDRVTLTNTFTESNSVSVSDLGTLSDMMQRFDNFTDIDGGLDIVSECDMVPEFDLMSDATMVPVSCVMPGSDITMLQTITSSSPNNTSDHLSEQNPVTIFDGLDLLQGCNQEPVSGITNESNTRPCSRMMIRENTRVEPNVSPALEMMPNPKTALVSNVIAKFTNPASPKQDIISLALKLSQTEDFDCLLNPSQINFELQLQSDDTASTLSQEMVAKSDLVIPHRPMSSAVRNFVLEINTTTPYLLTWPTEVNDFDPIVSYLVDQHMKIITSNTDVPREHLLEEQKRHAKEFRLREEMFGSLTPLPFEEYLNFLQTTGIDIDNRYELIKSFIPLFDVGMRRYIRFANMIPGFNDLCADDKVNLIGVGHFEFWFVGSFPGYNNDLKVARLPNGSCFHLKEMAKVWETGFISESFRLAETFQKLPLLREEFILVKCLTVFASDRCQLRNKKKVEDIQWKIIQCLCRMLRKNHPTEPNLLARIIDRLTELRSLSKRNAVVERQFYVWPIVYKYPLVFDTTFLSSKLESA